jgi:type I restriction enzyme S subunit
MQDLLTKDIEAHGNLRSEAAREFKNSPLGRIPKEWEVLRVEEVGSVRLGRQRSPKHQSGRFTTPYLRVANVFDGWIDYSDVLSMDFTPTEKEIYGLLPGDVLLNEGQSVELVGRSAMYEGEPNQYCFQNTLVRFRAFDENDPGYCQMVFKYWLDTGRFRDVASQTTSVAHLGADRFAQMPFPRPSLREQQRIYSVLKAQDEVIRVQQDYLQILHRVKTGLMQDLLTNGIDEHGNIRSESTHEFKDSPLGRIPKEWVVESLLEAVPVAEYGISVSLDDENGIPILRMNNLKDGEIDITDLKLSASNEAKKLLLRPLDVLFNRTNSIEHVGRTSIWRGQIENASFASYLVRLLPDLNKLLPEYLNYWLNLEHTQIAMRVYATVGVHQVNINPTNLRKLLISFPGTLEEQQAIVNMIDRQTKAIHVEVRNLEKLKAVKQGLMQDLLTGNVSVESLLTEREAAGCALP